MIFKVIKQFGFMTSRGGVSAVEMPAGYCGKALGFLSAIARRRYRDKGSIIC